MEEEAKRLLQAVQDGTASAGEALVWIAQHLEFVAVCAGVVVLAIALLIVWHSRRLNKRTGHFSWRRKSER